jgi:hypothetical protein
VLAVTASIFGTLPQWLTLVGIIGLALALRGGQIGPALSYLRDANSTLETENRELKLQLAEQVAIVASLRARTDLEPMQAALLAQLGGHEDRAQGRFEKTCVLLDLIAERLGAEPQH